MKILQKEILSDVQGQRIIRFEIQAPHIAKKAKPGQFVVVMVSEEGERIPLTVAATSKDSITLIMQEIGLSTRLLGRLKVGDEVYSLVGPMGHATPIKNYGNVALVAGGVGIAEIYPIVAALKDAGNYVITIIGARTKDIIFLEKELKSISSELHVATDDGSYGTKGFTTDVLKKVLKEKKIELVYAVGPLPMMRKASDVTKEFNVKTLVSLNAIMLDASGMCGGCRVTIDGKPKFACVDGPEFDASLVNWDELMKRTKMYTKQEKHICNLYKV